jgi:hypothetical protein
MNGIRILIALAALALAAFVAAAPATSHPLGLGSPELGDGLDLKLPDLGGGSGNGSGGGGGGGGSGGGGGGDGNAATVRVRAGDAAAGVNVACIRANVLGITAKVGSCNRARRGGGGGGGGGGAADGRADAGDVGARVGVGCIDLGLGDLGRGLQIGSCEAIMPPSDENPGGGGSGELPAQTGDGVGGVGAGGGDGSSGDGADCIAFDEVSSAGMPYGIPPWLAGLLGIAMFGFGAFVARRRRPHAEDVAV